MSSATFAFPRNQKFAVPQKFVLFMTENPSSPDGLWNLYQTCKFFFAKNPILLLDGILSRNKKLRYDDEYEIPPARAKFWPLTCLMIKFGIDLDKFYRITPRFLYIGYAEITLQDFEVIVAENTVERVSFCEAVIIGATVDIILDKLPNVNDFHYNNDEEVYSNETMKKLSLMERKTKLKYCAMFISRNSETLQPSFFASFCERNGSSEAEFILGVAPNLSFNTKTEFIEAGKMWKAEARFNCLVETMKKTTGCFL